jgi:hypothetical protein
MENNKVEHLIKQLENCTLSELNTLKQAQAKIAAQRTIDFLNAIEKSDLEKIKKLIELEVNFSDPDLWKTLVRNTNLANTSTEVIDYFMELNLKASPIDSTDICKCCDFSLTNGLRSYVNINPMDAFRLLIKEKLARYATSSNLKEYDFDRAKKYLNKETFLKLMPKIIEKFALYNSIEGKDTINNYIESNPQLIEVLFSNIRTEENINAFLKNKTYKKFLENYIKIYSTKEVMEKAISDASYSKISFLHQMGVSFPDEKAPYSNLFQKTSEEALTAQRYVINNIDDITFGNQVILKTVLHYKRSFASFGNKPDLKLQLITDILNKYTQEQAELLPEALKKREKNDETDLVQKFYDYKQFKKEIETSSNDEVEVERKRLKI